MRLIWLIGILVFVAAAFCNAQSSSRPTKSPKTVVEEFWKMDTEGGRLTDGGWRAADLFFARPIEPPKERIICVIYGDFAVRDPTVKDDTAEVIVGTAGTLWKIDPQMRLGTCSDQEKDFWLNKLVLTHKHWEFGPDHRTLKEVGNAPEWRLEKESNYVYLTVGTAIRYLSQVRDSTTHPATKKNAEQALSVLRRHH